MVINDDNRRYFIMNIIKLNKYKSYLELGIYDGKTISYIRNNLFIKCVGVDVVPPYNLGDFIFYNSTTDDFFVNNIDTFDIVFIDACHEIDSVKKDFVNSLNILNKFGTIIIHDVDPMSVEMLQPKYCNNSYKIVDWIEKNYKELNMIILAIDEAGIAIVNRKADRRIYGYRR